MTVLSADTLARLNAAVSVPQYDRRQVTAGIVHISVGNFHRSHQAMYIDTLMNRGAALDWGICGIGLRPVPGIDLTGYAHQLIERFSNPGVRDNVARLCANASDRIPKFLLPVVRQQLAAGGSFTRAVFGDLADDPRFTRVYLPILASLHERGVRETLADLDRYSKELP